MALSSTGTIRFSQIQGEHGGANPISMSEYYRGGAYVSNNNGSVGTGGQLNMSNFRGTVRAVYITYEIIGGGGSGGFGVDDGGSTGYGNHGAASTFSGGSYGLNLNVTANGGTAGRNGYQSRLDPRHGQGTHYGRGGYHGQNSAGGEDAPASSYGAGGGGGGGDSPSYNDHSGNGGEGGYAGTRHTGTVLLVPGTTIAVGIGAGGARKYGGFHGGAGAGGFARLTKGNNVSTYSSPGSYTYTVPS